jgi:hypothetical protein
MGGKRDFVGEIEEIRSRTGPPDWDNGITKLLSLCMQMKTLEHESPELAYFPVASVAAIETYLRWEIRRLIDSNGARYINNFRVDESSLRIGYDLLVAVHGKRVTIGELVAHSVRLNNLEAINKTMSHLLQTEFLDVVKSARDPESRREKGETAPTVITAASDTLARVKRTFELRHIICHEAHLGVDVRLAEVKELCPACYEFVLASRYGIAYYEDPDAPVTLEEACKAARERVEALDIQLKAVENRIISKLGGPPLEAFNAMQNAWRKYVEQEAGFDASHHMNGNRGAFYEQITTERLYNTRLEEMKKYADRD